MMNRLVFVIAVVALGLMAFAARGGVPGPPSGGGGGGGPSRGVELSVVEAAPYHFADQIHVAVTDPNAASDFVGLACSQNGEVVFAQFVNTGGVTGTIGPFVLGPSVLWPGGGADCELRAWAAEGKVSPIKKTATTFAVLP